MPLEIRTRHITNKKKQLLLTLEDVIVDTSIKYYETVTEGLYSV
ncbi:hypothetical protein [Tenacibaculum soleae]